MYSFLLSIVFVWIVFNKTCFKRHWSRFLDVLAVFFHCYQTKCGGWEQDGGNYSENCWTWWDDRSCFKVVWVFNYSPPFLDTPPLRHFFFLVYFLRSVKPPLSGKMAAPIVVVRNRHLFTGGRSAGDQLPHGCGRNHVNVLCSRLLYVKQNSQLLAVLCHYGQDGKDLFLCVTLPQVRRTTFYYR